MPLEEAVWRVDHVRGFKQLRDENTSLKSWSPNSAWTTRFCRNTQADQWLNHNVSVTRQGTIIYVKGESAIRDSGSRLEVSEGITQDGLEIA